MLVLIWAFCVTVLPVIIWSIIFLYLLYIGIRRLIYGPKIDPELVERYRQILEAEKKPENKPRSNFFKKQAEMNQKTIKKPSGIRAMFPSFSS